METCWGQGPKWTRDGSKEVGLNFTFISVMWDSKHMRLWHIVTPLLVQRMNFFFCAGSRATSSPSRRLVFQQFFSSCWPDAPRCSLVSHHPSTVSPISMFLYFVSSSFSKTPELWISSPSFSHCLLSPFYCSPKANKTTNLNYPCYLQQQMKESFNPQWVLWFERFYRICSCAG